MNLFFCLVISIANVRCHAFSPYSFSTFTATWYPFSSTQQLTATPNHPRFTSNVGFGRSKSAFHASSSSSTSRSASTRVSSTTSSSSTSKQIMEAKAVNEFIEGYIQARNCNTHPSTLLSTYFHENDVIYNDMAFYNPVVGREALLRHFHLFHYHDSLYPSTSTAPAMNQSTMVVEDMISSSKGDVIQVMVQYYLEDSTGKRGKRGLTFYQLTDSKISCVWDMKEPSDPKPGSFGLNLLKAVSPILDLVSSESGEESSRVSAMMVQEVAKKEEEQLVVEQYFDAWNKRNMTAAISCFAKDCTYSDLQFDKPLVGIDEMKQHLDFVAECLPRSFTFEVDELISEMDSGKIAVKWHVANNNKALSLTNGLSVYTTTTTTTGAKSELLQTGLDIPEQAPLKTGVLQSILTKLHNEPVRNLPLLLWMAYMYTVFFSSGILPGANALQLEVRTWEEVRDLSLNFFLVAPMLDLSFSPVVHPMLEGIFNGLLSWAALFAGFLSDERKDEKPNLLNFGVIVVGMQFLTSAFLLPYLVTRNSELALQMQDGDDPNDDSGQVVYREDIDGKFQAMIGEWRPLGVLLGAVGTGSIFWGLFARPEFGNLNERYASLMDLLSIDRVGSSFIVDLVIFALFQGWLVDDDLRRRGVLIDHGGNLLRDDDGRMSLLRNIAKYVPFFGLASYLAFRPPLASKNSS